MDCWNMDMGLEMTEGFGATGFGCIGKYLWKDHLKFKPENLVEGFKRCSYYVGMGFPRDVLLGTKKYEQNRQKGPGGDRRASDIRFPD